MGLAIYLAGPISKGDYIANIRQAIDAAEILKLEGHSCFVPHLTMLWCMLYAKTNSTDATTWKDFNFTWLERSDILIRLPGQSSGSDDEVRRALEKNILVFYGLDSFLDVWRRFMQSDLPLNRNLEAFLTSLIE